MCLVCEYERSHVHRLTLVPATDATCTKAGNKAYHTCSGCEDWFEDASGAIVISDKTSVIIAALGHDMVDATCTEASHCQRVGCSYTEGVALGHSFTNYVSNNDATCTADGTKTATCDRCDVTDTITDVGSAKGHDYADATCTEPKTCRTCGVTDGDVLGHNYGELWSKGEDGHWHECSVCGDKIDFAEHDYGTESDKCTVCEYERSHVHRLTLVPGVDATCTATGSKAYYICSGCEDWFDDASGAIVISDKTSVVIAALGHDYADATCSQPKTCKRCGATEGDVSKHDFSGNSQYCRYGCGTENPDYVETPIVRPGKPVPAPSTKPTKPETPQNPFGDVRNEDFFFDAVIWAVDNGITSGTSSTTFDPDKICTRAEMVTFLWRAAGKPEPLGKNDPFTDVTEDNYFYKAVLWAVENGITNGTSATTFSPDATCTRGQTVTFLYRYAGSPVTNGQNPFFDVSNTQYYYTAVIWAVTEGITKGVGSTAFAPDDFCTRGQIVTFIYRYQAS